MTRSTRWLALFAGLFLAFSMTSVDYAEARRGGSFGSRGMRTQQVVPPTRTAPQQTAPVERSMTPGTSQPRQTTPTQMQQQRPGLFNGLGGGLMRGLLLGGLIGLLLGHGFGGLAGLFGFALQALLLIGGLMLIMRLFASRNPAPAMAGGHSYGGASRRESASHDGARAGGFRIPAIGGGSHVPASSDFQPTQADLDIFEQRLAEVQAAFAREDHATLRRLTTPEMVSYLSEELADNAQKGLRNDVSAVRLLKADVAEAWSEGVTDYATAALNYEAIEVMRDRATGRAVEGDEHTPTETTEIWTFVRTPGQDWKLSAIQQA